MIHILKEHTVFKQGLNKLEINILIVDDVELNIELIKRLLISFSEDTQISINILTAVNGQEAVDICNSKSVNLVFMDVMMPIMDGVDATRLIKQAHPEIIIVVISTVGDEAKQKEILLNGAEDYIIKPLASPVFKRRLQNYIHLIEHRNHISTISNAQNLFTSKIYNYNMNFGILSDEDLSEFWEAMLIRLDFQHKIEDLTDLVRFVYTLGTLQLKQKFNFRVFVEEDIESFYFTLTNIKLIGCERLEKILSLNFPNAIYLCKNNKLTFLLQKLSIEGDMALYQNDVIKETKKETLKQKATVEAKSTQQTIQTFDILDHEELTEMEDHLIKINSIILLMENSSLTYDEIIDLCSYLRSIASILSSINDTYVISNALNNLSQSITNNLEYFGENSTMLFDFTSAFIKDLLFWKTKIFYEGAPSVDFLNDSIITNANMLNALLSKEENSEEDLDDIFNF